LLPWQLQLIVPSATSVTGHPWWVQVAEKARNCPGAGCVTTTSCSANTVPPPTGMSDVLASAPPWAEPPWAEPFGAAPPWASGDGGAAGDCAGAGPTG
jgi:hypothetical protein